MKANKLEAISELRFNDYIVEETLFRTNLDFHGEEVELQFSFNAQLHISPEKDKAIVDLTCKVFDEEFMGKTAPFYLKMCMKGFFDCVDMEIEQFRVNAVAILLPFMRATIASFTVQTGIPAVIIPPINVYNLFKKNKTSKK